MIVTKLVGEGYYTNDLDDYSEANVMYVGKERPDGKWIILRIDMNNGIVIRGASVVNNVNYTTYSEAWVNRLSLTYSYLKEVI